MNWDSVGQAAIMGAVSGGVAYGVGAAVTTLGLTSGADLAARTVAHGVSSGLQSSAFGGDFGSGFASGTISNIGGTLSHGKGYWASTGVSALSGGVASLATGGDFTQGALQGAFINTFNHWSDKIIQSIKNEAIEDTKFLYNKAINGLNSTEVDVFAHAVYGGSFVMMGIAPASLPYALSAATISGGYIQFKEALPPGFAFQEWK